MTLTDTKYLDYIHSKGWLSLWWKVFKSRVNKQVEILGQGQEKYKDQILTKELLDKFKNERMVMKEEVFNSPVKVKVKGKIKYVIRNHFNKPIEVYSYKK
jgi:hypothetical protein